MGWPKGRAQSAEHIAKTTLKSREWWADPENKERHRQTITGSGNGFFGRHHSPETRELLAKIGEQRRPTEETRRKLSAARTGKLRPGVGKGRKFSLEHRQRIAAALTGKKRSTVRRGFTIPFETRLKISATQKGRPNIKAKGRPNLKLRGPLNPNWKAGEWRHHRLLRDSAPYGEWRLAVFKRDGFRCRRCAKTGFEIVAHHVRPYRAHPDLRMDLANGLTLCVPCHRAVHRTKDPAFLLP